MSDEKEVNYGIWISGSGWVYGKNREALAFENKDVADYYAAWFRGKAVPIDQSLVDLEEDLLQAEKAKDKVRLLWRIFVTWLRKPTTENQTNAGS